MDKTPTVVVVLQGGQFSQAVSNLPVKVVLVDYDVEGTTDGIVQIQQSVGGCTEPAVGGEQEVQVDPEAVDRILRSFVRPPCGACGQQIISPQLHVCSPHHRHRLPE